MAGGSSVQGHAGLSREIISKQQWQRNGRRGKEEEEEEEAGKKAGQQVLEVSLTVWQADYLSYKQRLGIKVKSNGYR